MRRNWKININHVYMEANFGADLLENYALTTQLGFYMFSSPAPGIISLLQHDIYGLAY